ncbi:MAG: Family 2 glycosyl transferase [Verrucomicrobiales bacterium]|nr:Family 2 glycosyl transferase [Verrucomicrobiales bacterium]
MWSSLLLLIFWLSLALLFYAYFGYPVLMFLLGRFLTAKKQQKPLETLPSVTVVLAAHNEEQRIITRIQNLLASDYPPEKLDIVLVSDGSTDRTVANAQSLGKACVHVVKQEKRSGKAACLNAGLAVAAGEIVVFGDVRQTFPSETISRLVGHFSDPRIGAASGSLEIDPSSTTVGAGVDAYWKLEKFIRYSESVWDSSIGCTGAVYAIRRKLFHELPPDTLLDDVVTPMEIAVQEFRVVFDPTAIAFDPQSLEPKKEKIRKQRTLAGNFQMLFRYPHWLMPWKNRLWWQLISHKYLRLASPVLLITVFIANAMLSASTFFQIALLGQCVFYLAALLGIFCSSFKWLCFSLPAGFVFLNCMVVNGFRHYLRDSYKGYWPSTTT